MPHNVSNARWRKSSRSAQANDQCVELAGFADVVAVRDSKDPDGPKLTLTTDDWRALTRGVKSLGGDQA
ncbi:DUF397 domain-containing protein [Spirillospora sp. NPDC049652]